MKRRQFIQLVAGASLAAGAPEWASSTAGSALAATTLPFDGPYFLNIIASGGMDQSSWSDPRNDQSINRYPGNAKAGRAGNIWYAPIGRNKEIFDKYYDRMLVFNGLSVTGGHSSGSRWQRTGRKANGFPEFAELYAAIVGNGLPIPWYSTTSGINPNGLVPYTRIDSNALKQLGAPNLFNADIKHQRQEVVDTIKRYRLARLEEFQKQQKHLPFAKQSINNLQQARLGTEMFDRLNAALPDTFEGDAHQAMVQFAAGVTASATIRSRGGWDTHNAHVNKIDSLCTNMGDIIDQAWKWAETFGIADQLVIHISSDVGRTPKFNSKSGKDHWAYGSSTIMMKNAPWGNRVVGMSGPKHQGTKINPMTLQADSNGVQLNPAHLQRALREILGIDQHPLALKFAFNEAEVDTLNPNNTSPVITG